MRKYKYIILSILTFILFPISIKGAVCSDSEKVNYQSLAKNITFSYDFIEENQNAYFNITFTNIPEWFYLKNLETNEIYNYSGSEMMISRLEQGLNLRYGVYVDSANCGNVLLYTHYITLPYYNPYYKDDLCNGLEGFKYCNKWMNKKITYEEFKENIINYKNKINKDNEEQTTDVEFNLLDYMIQLYLDYYFIILPIIIVIGVVIIKKFNKKNDLF